MWYIKYGGSIVVKIYNCPFCNQSARIIDGFEEEESSYKIVNDEKLTKITWYKNYKIKRTTKIRSLVYDTYKNRYF